MMIDKYINDLLYRYDCVIVPDFGGFVTNRIGAKVNHFTHTFHPPTKQISFNSNLKHNDGLLANYIASAENISFDEATASISLAVAEWRKEIQSKIIKIDNIGSLGLNEEQKLIFNPNEKVNYLTSSFGLPKVDSSLVKRNETPPVIPVFTDLKEEKKGTPVFIKYAATAAILMTLGFVGFKGYEQYQQKEVLANKQKNVEQKIQEATFVISNPLPTIQLNVTKESSKSYHIVAGAFRFPENAKKKVNQLKKQGYNAKVWGVNKWGLTQVSINRFSDATQAYVALEQARKEVSKEAWLFIEN